ncbi:MBL fold metallo-hydrolase [Candidatus Harpocratesius sp.]
MGQLTVVYENHPHPNRVDLEPAHGFSVLIETNGIKILFDTGWDGDLLLQNLNNLNLSLLDLEAVFISHRHWDHAGGIPKVLTLSHPKHIFLPSDYSLVQPKEFLRYAPSLQIHRMGEKGGLDGLNSSLFSSGTLKSKINIGEHALLLRSERFDGNLIIVGCLHPGLKSFINATRDFGEVKAFLGGMHGFNDVKYLEKSGISHLFAGHCTRNPDILQTCQSVKYFPIYVGFQMKF